MLFASVAGWRAIYGGPAPSVSRGMQLIQVRRDLARSVPYGDTGMRLLAESVALDAESPRALAQAVAGWIESSTDQVTDAVEHELADFNREHMRVVWLGEQA